MTRHFERAIDKLKKQVLELSAAVEEAVRRSVKAFVERDIQVADSVIAGDLQIDEREVEIEEECLKILALNQPVAHDLRFTVAMLKMNNDVERIGDLAVNVARRAHTLALIPKIDLPFDLEDMAAKVRDMLTKSLEALINQDVALASRVLESDDEIDGINKGCVAEVERRVRLEPGEAEALICCLGVARALERIADHSTNIAEDVIYLISGDIVRHRRKSGALRS